MSMSLQDSLYTVLHRFALCSLPAVCAEVLPQPAKLSVILIPHLPHFFTFSLEKFMFCLLLSHVMASLQIKATCKIPWHKCLCHLQILIQASQPLQNGAQATGKGMCRRMAHVAARHQESGRSVMFGMAGQSRCWLLCDAVSHCNSTVAGCV